MKKIFTLIFLLFLSINIFAESKQTAGLPTRPFYRVQGQTGSSEYQSPTLIKTIIDGETHYITATNTRIDSATITVDVSGLAGYNQVQKIVDYINSDSQKIITNIDTVNLHLSSIKIIGDSIILDLGYIQNNQDTIIIKLQNIFENIDTQTASINENINTTVLEIINLQNIIADTINNQLINLNNEIADTINTKIDFIGDTLALINSNIILVDSITLIDSYIAGDTRVSEIITEKINNNDGAVVRTIKQEIIYDSVSGRIQQIIWKP